MTIDELSTILADHEKWLADDDGARANLSGATLWPGWKLVKECQR